MTLADTIFAAVTTTPATPKAIAAEIDGKVPSVRRTLNALTKAGKVLNTAVEGVIVYALPAVGADAPEPVNPMLDALGLNADGTPKTKAFVHPQSLGALVPKIAAKLEAKAEVAAPKAEKPAAVKATQDVDNDELPQVDNVPSACTCPRCGVHAEGRAEIDEVFGTRKCKQAKAGKVVAIREIAQSYCRGCRKVHAQERRAKLAASKA
jgi:hypothetical protein